MAILNTFDHFRHSISSFTKTKSDVYAKVSPSIGIPLSPDPLLKILF